MFAAFRSRVTRSYVAIALLLIVAIVGSTSPLAFALYARSMNDAIPATAQRISEAAAQQLQGGTSLAQAAPKILAAAGRSRFHILILDSNGRPISQSRDREPPAPGRGFVIAIGQAVGLPHARIPVRGGEILIAPDFDRFGALLWWYWEIAIPVGIVAVLIAWLAGRRITARAVGPLADVTRALHTIAAGDFTPQPVASQGGDLSELTNAYNEVAYRLASATAERARTETQMRQFIADAGHELRTPLTIMMGYLDVLQQGIVQGPEATQRTYVTMLEESRRMRALIEKLILLARLERPSPASVSVIDLSDVVRRAALALEPLAKGRIRIEGDGELLLVNANNGELVESVKNAIENSLKYAPASDVRVTLTNNGAQACVTVHDDGPGMEPADVEHAFDRFYRGAARNDVEGSGLGLSIAKTAVERAGGTASLTSAPNEGTTVRFCLPAITR